MDAKKLYPGKKTCIIFKCLFDLGFNNLVIMTIMLPVVAFK